jgi:hypothetical protein
VARGVRALRAEYLQYTEQSQDDPRLTWAQWLDTHGYDLTGLDRAAMMIPPKVVLPTLPDVAAGKGKP